MSARRPTSTAGSAHEEEWLDAASDCLAAHVLTEDGIIWSTNRAFDAMFGAERGRFVGRHQAVLNNYSVDGNLRLLRNIRREIDASGSWRGFFVNRDAHGMEFTSRAHVYPVRYYGHRCFVCFQQPVSEGVRWADAASRAQAATTAFCVAAGAPGKSAQRERVRPSWV